MFSAIINIKLTKVELEGHLIFYKRLENKLFDNTPKNEGMCVYMLGMNKLLIYCGKLIPNAKVRRNPISDQLEYGKF